MTKAITIKIEDDLYNALKKRARKNLQDIEKLVEDIVRRSMLSYKGTSSEDMKIDDALVSVFSRSRRGRKKKR